jgi:hypothetical protein
LQPAGGAQYSTAEHHPYWYPYIILVHRLQYLRHPLGLARHSRTCTVELERDDYEGGLCEPEGVTLPQRSVYAKKETNGGVV